jgi:hypothetical protein
MYSINFKRAISLSALAVGLATSAFGQIAPVLSYMDEPVTAKGQTYLTLRPDLDFTKTSANPAADFPTFPNPRNPGNIVKYYTLNLVAAQFPGGCFEIASFGPAGSDVILSVQNQAGTWKWLADDNSGGGQFRARIYLPDNASYLARISEYSSPNNNNTNSIDFMKVNRDGGSAITATSCRATGMPFWQPNLNSGNPFNPS